MRLYFLYVNQAVLGFVKVLVSSLQAKDLQTLLTNIVGILHWSAVVRNHFREKVTCYFEMLQMPLLLNSVDVKTAIFGSHTVFDPQVLM